MIAKPASTIDQYKIAITFTCGKDSQQSGFIKCFKAYERSISIKSIWAL